MTRRHTEAPEYAAFARRILGAMSKRVSAGDVAALPDLLGLQADLDRFIDEAVAGLRAEPWAYSWAQIADVVGTSRQAAQKRWGHLGGARKVGGQPTELR